MKKEINYTARIDVLRAMDLIMNALNDEELNYTWKAFGIEDECKDFTYYAETDAVFSEMMHEFCRIMRDATADNDARGALWVDNVLSGYPY